MIDFITENANLIPSILAIIGGVYAFAKWIDERRLTLEDRKVALKNERLKEYNHLLKTISGVSDSGKVVGLLEQVSSALLLLEYKEYDDITLKVFGNKKLTQGAPDTWLKNVLPELEQILDKIKFRNS